MVHNPSFPDSLICVCSRLRQIGRFRSLRCDCTRPGHRRMSYTVPEIEPPFLYHIEAGTSAKYHVIAQFQIQKHEYHKFHDFFLLWEHSNREICAFDFLIVRLSLIWQIFRLQFLIGRSDLLILSTKFYDLSVSCNCFSKTEFGASLTEGLENKSS